MRCVSLCIHTRGDKRPNSFLGQRRHYLKKRRMTLQLGGAEGSHGAEAGPEVDIGEQGTGSEQQTRRSLH